MSAVSPPSSVTLARRLPSAAVREALVALVFLASAGTLAFTSAGTRAFVSGGGVPSYDLLAGIALGLGEAMLVALVFQAAVLLSTRSYDIRIVHARALAAARRGWGGSFAWVSDCASATVALAVCLLAALAHEALLRGVVVSLAPPAGASVAIAVGTGISVAVRVALAPTPRVALHPACTAGLLAVVHGWLALQDTALAPLAAAHAVVLFVLHRS